MSENQAADEGAVVQEQAAEVAVVGKKKAKVASGNLIADVAVEVENLTKPKALNLATQLAEQIETNYFRLGGVLKVIFDNSWFEGAESFDVFVVERFGFKPRKARYLMDIYTELVTKQIPWEKVAHLGWTKLKDLAKVLTLDNLDEWVAKAETLTVVELQAALNATPQADGDEPPKPTDNVKVLKFKLVNDQVETVQEALNKAKAEAGTEFDNVALEMICTGYLGGSVSVGVPAKSFEDQVKELGFEAALTAISALYPEYDIQVGVEESNGEQAEA